MKTTQSRVLLSYLFSRSSPINGLGAAFLVKSCEYMLPSALSATSHLDPEE